MADDERIALAAEAYVYGFPLLFNLEQVERFVTTGVGAIAAAPFNAFSHATQLAGPADTFVTINNDTLYSIAQVDLGAGPQLLTVPDTGARYDVFQFVDAWTNNFAYVGTRATGSGGGRYLLAPPAWDGNVPDGATRIDFPTRVASIVGRLACDGEQDLPAIHVLQAQIGLAPLDRDGDGAAAAAPGLPQPDPGVPEALAFFERLRVSMAAFPPSAPEQEYQQRFAPLGLPDDGSPYADAPADLAAALTAGVVAGRARLEQVTRAGTRPLVNGWMIGLHLFDYNLDNLGVGALDDPAWKIADREKAHVERAIAARAGLWGNHGYEAAYSVVYVDADGEQLTGARRYAIRFEQPPPCEAFWSLTMYDMPDFYLVANPIDRYSIGDRTPGLRYADDGSLTLLMQHEPPADEEERANWLPAPSGDFRPVMRMYVPDPAVLDGTYVLPPVTRLA
ncbi:MAG TPA: DUF1254 domain-containing protein [Conexibacter sp.]|jgi:hypothetical protein|nr:DUF1254 domain-containing protein [Conexibacter sp.]